METVAIATQRWVQKEATFASAVRGGSKGGLRGLEPPLPPAEQWIPPLIFLAIVAR